MDRVTVRRLEDNDIPTVVEIYNDVLRTTSAIWSEHPDSVHERQESVADARAHDYPALVAEDDSGVLGFATSGPFRAWSGYANTSEHSIHVRRAARGRGLGSRLLSGMEVALRARHVHVMVAGIDADNVGSHRFHVRAGFVEVARMPEVGVLRGTWRDLVLLQKTLG